MKSSGRSRAHHPKARTGCITCKAHRVKCDETRPSCLRCQRLARTCQGYRTKQQAPSSRYGSSTIQTRSLKPKDDVSFQVLIKPSDTLFDTDQEYQYFSLFSDKIASKLSPYFKQDMWSRMILQACAAEWSIRQAAVAIGALEKTYEAVRRGGSLTAYINHNRLPAPGRRLPPGVGMTPPQNSTQDAISHHLYALKQYDRAIRRMRENISSGKQNIRTTLITCIVTTCFEAMHGNHESASTQLQSGIVLFQDWKSKQRDASKHPLGFSSPAPEIVDDFLVQTFGRMEIQTMSFFDTRPVECHLKLKHEGSDIVKRMPKQFPTFDQARIYLDLIMRRLLHFTITVHRSSSNRQAFFTTAEPQMKSPGLVADTGRSHQTPIQTGIQVGTTTEDAILNKELIDWKSAFAPLLAHALTPVTKAIDKISALTLIVAAIASQICARGALFDQETSYDIFLPEFRAIISYASQLLVTQDNEYSVTNVGGNDKPGVAFTFDLGVLTPLSIVAIKCRDSKIRRAALELLSKYPRREGVWDGAVTAALGRWAMGLEEGLDGDGATLNWGREGLVIPEQKRVRKVGVKFDLARMKVIMGCLQMDEGTGEWVERCKDYTW